MAGNLTDIDLTDDELQLVMALRQFKERQNSQQYPLLARQDYQISLDYFKADIPRESPVDLLPADDAHERHRLMQSLLSKIRQDYPDGPREFTAQQISYMMFIPLANLQLMEQEASKPDWPELLNLLIQIGIFTNFIMP